MLIDGIHVPLTAPFTRDGASYLRKLEYNVGRYSLTPAAALVALTGEGAELSDDETCAALRVIGAAAAAEKVLIAAVSKSSVRGALAVAAQAAESDFDAVLVNAPTGWQSLAAAELLLFFQAVADASPLPVMLGSDAAAAGFALPVGMVAELATHWNVIGLYDADLTSQRYGEIVLATRQVKRDVTVTTVFAPVTRRMLAASGGLVSAESLAGGAAVAVASGGAAVKTRLKTVGFQVMAAGDVTGLIELLEAGVAGSMPRLGACAPQACYEVYAAFKDGDPALAGEKQERLVEVDALMRELGVTGVRYGCDFNGYYGGAPRLPRVGLDGEARGRVERVMAGLRN
jgi:4-hydroxy-2-oxoglutarate aldolase